MQRPSPPCAAGSRPQHLLALALWLPPAVLLCFPPQRCLGSRDPPYRRPTKEERGEEERGALDKRGALEERGGLEAVGPEGGLGAHEQRGHQHNSRAQQWARTLEKLAAGAHTLSAEEEEEAVANVEAVAAMAVAMEVEAAKEAKEAMVGGAEMMEEEPARVAAEVVRGCEIGCEIGCKIRGRAGLPYRSRFPRPPSCTFRVAITCEAAMAAHPASPDSSEGPSCTGACIHLHLQLYEVHTPLAATAVAATAVATNEEGVAEEEASLGDPRAGERRGVRPMITIVLPVHNGERWIDGCMQALLAQTWVRRHQLDVVDESHDDDGSHQHTHRHPHAHHHPHQHRHQHPPGPHSHSGLIELSAFDDGSTDRTWELLHSKWAPFLQARGWRVQPF